ncbi:hypothetical protein MKZ38_002235 [Zalerion maritima]|uniref:Cell wall proline rich protein n=1 Tax=Zalerion maritima TaxID=339359 RepID=A0AAD5WSM5_9PEZI|nr:hypothetical protein MKZ38_002235 [Zalerion maritima]
MMATACGPQGPAESVVAVSFDQPASRHIAVSSPSQTAGTQDDLQESPRTAPPPPNPPFVFPAKGTLSSTPSSYSRASGRRPRSAIESSDRQFAVADDYDISSAAMSPALPSFSFNPGASLCPDSLMLSPPLSPQSPRAIPTRPGGHGHRRGGSEYVGGSIRSGDAIAVLSSSPTKSESGFASPTLPPPRPAGRRGHAHRRSAALSAHDLSSIMNPTSPNPSYIGTNELPSPAEPQRGPEAEPRQEPAADCSVEEESEQTQKTDDEQGCESSAPPKPASRARVGFSDNIEYIPRPLSLVSSDTSSTITAKPGHSVSGSISSVVSIPTSTPIELEHVVPLAPSTCRTANESRPSTAGAILERTQSTEIPEQISASPRRRNSIPLLLSLGSPSSSNPSSPSPTKTPKRWSFFGLEPFLKDSRPVSSSSSESSSRHDSSANSSSENIPEISNEEGKSTAKASGKKSKKPKKVKVWAGSLLTRRTKAKQKSKGCTIKMELDCVDTQTTETGTPESLETETPTAPVMPVVMVTGSPGPSQPATFKPQPASDDDSSCAIIDLDAALGPFNTPLPYNAEWEAAQRAGAPSKRKLHSAAGMSNFSGPGGHYHRRAESAPEMAPFEHGRFGIPHFGSSSTMADVFEEEEEDEETSQAKKKNAVQHVSGSGLKEESDTYIDIEVSGSQEGAMTEPIQIELTSKQPPLDDEQSDSGQSNNESRIPAASAIDETPTARSTAPDATILEITSLPSHDSEGAGSSPRRVVPLHDLAPVDVSLQLPSASLAPGSPFSMSHSSPFPSPRSPLSYDANMVSTAPSSIAEENTFQSLLLGEPGPEVRYSIDADIPSLTSSNSTMTKDSSFSPHPRSSHGNLSGQRPASFSAAAFSRRRSSLASLSRLISSSHGEKSKLSMEVTCDSEPEKKPKHSKTKRLSRKLQFWKPARESTSTN